MRKIKYYNGNRYSHKIRERAVLLRREGFTHREIRNKLGISLGTAELWTRAIHLSEEQKDAIFRRRTLCILKNRTKEKKLKLIRHARKFLAPYMKKQQYTSEDLLKKISIFYKQHGRIPMKREFNSLRVYRLRFGSWNNAIIKAGFIPNPSSAKHYISSDGHICDSLAELVIDNYLFENDVKHQRSTPYVGHRRFRTDFLIHNVYVEYFGRVGLKDYDDVIVCKRDICRQNNIRLIELYPKDVLEKKKLPIVLAEFIHKEK